MPSLTVGLVSCVVHPNCKRLTTKDLCDARLAQQLSNHSQVSSVQCLQVFRKCDVLFLGAPESTIRDPSG